MNIAATKSEFSASIEKLSARLQARKAATLVEQTTGVNSLEADCVDLLARLLEFVCPKPGETSEGMPSASAAPTSGSAAPVSDMSCSAEFFVGRHRALEYFNALAARRMLLSTLSQDRPVDGISTDDKTRANLACHSLMREILRFSQQPSTARKNSQSRRDSPASVLSNMAGRRKANASGISVLELDRAQSTSSCGS